MWHALNKLVATAFQFEVGHYQQVVLIPTCTWCKSGRVIRSDHRRHLENGRIFFSDAFSFLICMKDHQFCITNPRCYRLTGLDASMHTKC